MKADPRKAQLREALAAYHLDTRTINRYASLAPHELRQALRCPEHPLQITGLLAILEILLTNDQRIQIKTPTDAAALAMVQMSHLDQEELRVIALDTKSRILAFSTVYRGSVNSALIRVGEVFKDALRLNATSIIALHNHPSGDPNPSPEDCLLTRQLVEAGKLLDIDCVDHLVIGHGKFVSMREKGLGFSQS